MSLILIILGITLAQKTVLHSDQPNGEPWSEEFLMEYQHEGVETLYEIFNVNEGCGFICESHINELHENHYEDEEDAEESEVGREFDVWWEQSFPEEELYLPWYF